MADLVVYRLVRTNPPTVEHFRSLQAQGRPVPANDTDAQHRWDGVSVYDSEFAARRLARGRPYLGRYLARLRTGEGSSIRWEKTGGPGHFTLWGTAEQLLRLVEAVTPI